MVGPVIIVIMIVTVSLWPKFLSWSLYELSPLYWELKDLGQSPIQSAQILTPGC